MICAQLSCSSLGHVCAGFKPRGGSCRAGLKQSCRNCFILWVWGKVAWTCTSLSAAENKPQTKLETTQFFLETLIVLTTLHKPVVQCERAHVRPRTGRRALRSSGRWMSGLIFTLIITCCPFSRVSSDQRCRALMHRHWLNKESVMTLSRTNSDFMTFFLWTEKSS